MSHPIGGAADLPFIPVPEQPDLTLEEQGGRGITGDVYVPTRWHRYLRSSAGLDRYRTEQAVNDREGEVFTVRDHGPINAEQRLGHSDRIGHESDLPYVRLGRGGRNEEWHLLQPLGAIELGRMLIERGIANLTPEQRAQVAPWSVTDAIGHATEAKGEVS